MILLVTLALISDGASPLSTTPVIGQLPEHCARQEKLVRQDDPPAGPRRLNEMPDAEPQFAVVRRIDGCPILAKVSQRTQRR